MAQHNTGRGSARVERRLAEIRGGAPRRSPTVRVLAAYAQHTDCNLATLGFIAGADFDQLLVGTRLQGPRGQSPFAFMRGLAFENMLRERGYAATLDLLRTHKGFSASDARIENLRDRFPKSGAFLPHRVRATRELLRLIVRNDPAAPNLIDGAVLRASIAGVEAYFEADALASRSVGPIQVAEVKSFPKVDERVDPDKLGAALDQVAIYLLLLREEIRRLGGDPDRLVSERAMLITPRNVGMRPTLSEQGVAARIARAEKLLSGIPDAGELAAAAPAVSFGAIADQGAEECRRLNALERAADLVRTAYRPSCLSGCGLAQFCRERAYNAGSPCVAGTGLVRLLPGVQSLGRAEELTRGAPPADREAPTAAQLERAGRLYDELATPGAGGSPPQLGRRHA